MSSSPSSSSSSSSSSVCSLCKDAAASRGVAASARVAGGWVVGVVAVALRGCLNTRRRRLLKRLIGWSGFWGSIRFGKMFSESSACWPLFALAARHLYLPNGQWNIYKTFSQTFGTTWRPRLYLSMYDDCIHRQMKWNQWFSPSIMYVHFDYLSKVSVFRPLLRWLLRRRCSQMRLSGWLRLWLLLLLLGRRRRLTRRLLLSRRHGPLAREILGNANARLAKEGRVSGIEESILI